MARSPDFDVMLRSEEKRKDGKYTYYKVGAAWDEDNGCSISIDFPAQFILTPGMKLRLFERRDTISSATAKV